METHHTEEQLVPPVLDQAELIGNSAADFPVIEAEPEEELDLPLDTAQQQRLLLDESDGHRQGGPPLTLPTRPGLQRGTSIPTPAPLHLPPPAPHATPSDAAQTDSLSLSQVQNLVRGIPKVDSAPYAFNYDDASSFEEELEEWFSYTVEEQAMLLKTQASFALLWSSFNGPSDTSDDEGGLDWESATPSHQRNFVEHLLGEFSQREPVVRLKSLEALVYVLLGCWHETAGLPQTSTGREVTSGEASSTEHGRSTTYENTAKQASLIKRHVHLIVIECDGLDQVVDELQSSLLRTCGGDNAPDDPRNSKEAERREVWCAMTAVYVILEVARSQEKIENDLTLRSAILGLHKSDLLMVLVNLVSKLRWDESITLPLGKISLLLWKTMLVTFGGLAEVGKAKSSFKDKNLESSNARGQPLITASPLDYHLFRQEISSKYPAYNPPPPLFPLEPENNSILPPLKNHPNKVAGNHVFGSGLGDTNGNTTSILHQPVHIATPAPSPPPSPAGPGGKGGKKQNYQTNQLFPFLYPPLDESSNKLGGKGSTDMQDLLVGRKWEGSDIPASILEAAELFAKRMKATRAMKQLWEERVAFMKYERGWTGTDDHLGIEELSLEPRQGQPSQPVQKIQHSGSTEDRLDLVEQFYVSDLTRWFACLLLTFYQRNALPNLQSLIIVLIKAILAHVTALVTQSSGANSLQSGFQFQDNQNGTTAGRPDTNGVNGHSKTIATNEELDAMRTQEVLDKAVTGTLILMLKWFKVSRT